MKDDRSGLMRGFIALQHRGYRLLFISSATSGIGGQLQRMITAAILCYCGFLVVLGLSPWFWLAFIAAAGLGLSDSMQSTPRNAAIQLMSPDALRGRVTSFQQMLVTGSPALGQSAMGSVAGALGAPVALIGGAIICAAINIGIFIQRKDLRAREMGTAAEGEAFNAELADASAWTTGGR